MGRTGRFIYDGLRLISFGLQVNTKKHKHCAKAQDCFGRNSRPPIASQWAAVRITTEACRRKNPQITPGVYKCLFYEFVKILLNHHGIAASWLFQVNFGHNQTALKGC